MATSGSKSVAFTSWDTLKFSWSVSSQSVTNNTSTVAWKLQLIATSSGRLDSTASKAWSVSVNGTNYSGTNTVGISNNSTKTLASGTTTITHDSNGDKTFSYSFSQAIKVTFAGTYIGTITGSGTGTLPNIPRASVLAASNGTLGTTQTFTVTRYSSSYTHTISFACGNARGTITENATATSIKWTPPVSLANQNTTGTAVSVKLTIKTYSGSTLIGENTKTISCSIPSSVKPSCTLTISDAAGKLDSFGVWVAGQSRVKAQITATTAYGSAISSYKATANGVNYTTSSFTTDTLKSGTQTITATVTDKRGRSGSASKEITVVDYTAPQITLLKVRRCASLTDGSEDINGEFAQITFSANITDVNSKNTASYKLEYKKAAEEEYTVVMLDYSALNVTEGTYIFAAESGSSYNVRLTAIDAITQTASTTVVSTAEVLMHLGASGRAMGIGKIAEVEGGLDIGYVTRFYGGILHPILEPESDLNEIRTPNTYVGANVSTYRYANCPIDSGTFTLKVIGAGEEGQVRQTLIECKKTDSRTYERFYYQSTWGEWVCVSDFAGTLLWEGAIYMHDTQSIDLAEAVSKQRTGIVLVFCRYSGGEVQNYHFTSHFVPKMLVKMHGACGHVFYMGAVEGDYLAAKYLYISDTTIKGNEYNDNVISDTNNGISYTNNATVLRYVIGV